MKTSISRIAAAASVFVLGGIGFVLAGTSAQAAPSHEQTSVAKAEVRVQGGKAHAPESKSTRHEDSSKSKESSKNCHDDGDAEDAPVVVVVG